MDIDLDIILHFYAKVPSIIDRCIKKLTQSSYPHGSHFKDALLRHDVEKVKETAEKLKGYTINKLLTFNDPPWRFYLPALCIAIQWKNKEMVHCLLENGADPNRQGKITYNGADCWFLTPLQLVLRHIPEEGWPFDPELAEMLLLAGAEINKQVGITIEDEEEGGSMRFTTGNTYLHHCICHQQSYVVFDFLLDHGADLLKTEQMGKTPLHMASEVHCYNPYFVDELIRRGGLTQEEDDEGNTVLINLLMVLRENVDGIVQSLSVLHQAGYDLRKDKSLLRLDLRHFAAKNSIQALESGWLAEWLLDTQPKVLTLKQTCRLVVRKAIGKTCSYKKLSQLQLPSQLIDYLYLRDHSNSRLCYG
ncbi:hypothetical protein C0Q70_18875 [Pomacea canaliculata]|uniref:SOCS box domain-containing protein n=1 Tax=Pomacea canaliculata TaxID=400727 RepID=A0A2T7NHT6_POMCA|nr:uncharacterized protein LOC112553190 [Pomacea canaliculata]PVD20716.1 hypothetical protein C0Q70_18875 [Pomacea canaliculata]